MDLTPHHYGISVSSIDDVVPFYRDALGLEEVASRRYEQGGQNSEALGTLADVSPTAFEFVLLKAGDVHIELIEFESRDNENTGKGNPTTVGESHICFSVPDLDEAMRELGDDADIVGSTAQFHDGSRLVYLTDPEGNVVELTEWGDG